MSMEFIDLKAQYSRLQTKIHERTQRVYAHGQFIMGPEVGELEARLAAFTGSRHCIAVANGTDALFIALMALGVGPGDEVITSPFTFIATGEMIALIGAKPVFVDIDPRTFNLDPALLEAAITPKTKAIMPVSLYGQCADFDTINSIAGKYGLPVIEDGAQSFGATYKGRRSCALSTIGCTSFFPSKPLGCYGDAGAIFTDNDLLAHAMRQIRVHGQERRYYHARLGVNGRMDTLQAAVLLVKMEVFEEEIQLRQRAAARYDGQLRGVVNLAQVETWNTSVYAQYTISVAQRDEVAKTLKAAGIPTAVHYPLCLHQQPAILQPGVVMPNAEHAARTVLSLPMHPYLAPDDAARVVDAVKEAVAAVPAYATGGQRG